MFDEYQQVFSLSLASNLVNDLKGTEAALQQSLQSVLTNALPTIGDWSIVWGPVVWKNKPDDEATGPDNSWYVAYNPSLQFEDGSVHPTYVIAVAGTPLESQYAWFQENFAVDTVADFNLWVANGISNPPETVKAKDVVPGTPYVAIGTVRAVYTLLNTPARADTPSAGMTLIDFLCSLDISDSTKVITAGHSLGGALSPSLALALVSSGILPSNSTLTYPTAGPSPGNGAFSQLFAEAFPAIGSGEAGSYKGWNRNLVNTLDVVPQAWCAIKAVSPAQNLGNIPTIYGEPALPIVLGLTTVFAVRVFASGVLYQPLPSKLFTAEPPSAPPKNLEEFLQILGPQHGVVYFELVGVPIPALDKQQLGVGLHEKNEKEKRFNHPVLAEFEWALEHPDETQEEIKKVEGSEEAQNLA